MTSLIDFLPLTSETIDSVRARLDADANAGVDPTSAEFIDTTSGGFWYDLTQALALEIARLWDMAGTSIPAVAFPAFAWGSYLDDHADALGLARKDSSKAGGVVRFTGDASTVIAAGTEVATAVLSEDDDPISFITLAEGTISATTVDIEVEAVDAGTSGNVSAGTVTVLVTGMVGIASITNPAAISGGTDVESDEDLRDRVLLALRGASGAGNISDYEQWALAYEGVVSVVVEPVWNGAGTVRVIVASENSQPVSDVVKYGLQDELDPPSFVTATTAGYTLPAATIAVTSTTGAVDPAGTIRVGTEEVTYTGVTPTTFTGCSGGTGTYLSGERVSQGFDNGEGKAPIGAIVTVDTVDPVPFTITATITFADGYSLDGAAGTIATEDDILASVARYAATLRPGDDVVLYHVIGQFFRINGVLDASTVEINGSAANLAIAGLEIAVFDSVGSTLS